MDRYVRRGLGWRARLGWLFALGGMACLGVACPSHIIMIRHGEKPVQGDHLTCKGLNRALGLAGYFNQHDPLAKQIYVPTMSAHGETTKQARMFETIIPFAVANNVPINSTFSKGDYAGVVNDLLKGQAGISVLVVWEHSNITGLAKELIKKTHSLIPNLPSHWDDSDYDTVYDFVSWDNQTYALDIKHEGLNDVPDRCAVDENQSPS